MAMPSFIRGDGLFVLISSDLSVCPQDCTVYETENKILHVVSSSLPVSLCLNVLYLLKYFRLSGPLLKNLSPFFWEHTALSTHIGLRLLALLGLL